MVCVCVDHIYELFLALKTTYGPQFDLIICYFFVAAAWPVDKLKTLKYTFWLRICLFIVYTTHRKYSYFEYSAAGPLFRIVQLLFKIIQRVKEWQVLYRPQRSIYDLHRIINDYKCVC